MKIPTLLALVLLSIIIVVGISTKSYLATLIPKKINQAPPSITQSNLSPDSISLSWKTEEQTPTELIYTTDKNFFKDVKSAKDDRDQQVENRNLHFITLQELQPNTTYYFKLGTQPLFGKSNQFSTPKEIGDVELKIPPLVGSVVDNNLRPVSEALISVAVTDYFPLLTTTNQNGSFVLPIKLLYRQNDLAQIFNLSQNPDTTLTITKDDQTTKINLKLDKLPSPLPPFIFGQDLDLTNPPATSSATPIATPAFDFDVNGDGKINLIDQTTVQSNIGKTKFNARADINQDGGVDQQDLDLVKNALK